MPREFNKCVSGGGRVKTIKPKPGRYLPVCFPKGGGPSKSGEVKKTKSKGK